MQCMFIKDHTEEHAAGSAEKEVVNYEGDVECTRSHLYKQFGSGAGRDIMPKKQSVVLECLRKGNLYSQSGHA